MRLFILILNVFIQYQSLLLLNQKIIQIQLHCSVFSKLKSFKMLYGEISFFAINQNIQNKKINSCFVN